MKDKQEHFDFFLVYRYGRIQCFIRMKSISNNYALFEILYQIGKHDRYFYTRHTYYQHYPVDQTEPENLLLSNYQDNTNTL